MSKVKTYIKATRLPFTSASVLPVIVTALWCWNRGEFSFVYALSAVLGAFFLHLGANLMNDYYDTFGSDPLNKNPTPFSGGSRVVINGEMSAKGLFIFASIFYILAGITGILLFLYGRKLILLFGLIGAMLGFLYSASPVSFMSRGVGELAIFLAFGPVLTGGAGYVIAGEVDVAHFLIGIPFGIFTTAILWINEFPDIEADSTAGKRNLVVRLGVESAKTGYYLLILFGFLSIIILIITGIYPAYAIIGLFALPLAFRVFRILSSFKDFKELVPAQAMTIMLQGLVTILTGIGVLLERI
jgi:1,4-dihydroxy-2-naphthoate octaprenyltransferase